jgi:hypothetical protein
LLKRFKFWWLLVLLVGLVLWQARPAGVDELFAEADPAPAMVTATPFNPVTQTPTPTLPQPTATAIPTETPIPRLTTLLFTGVIVPARCVQAAIDARGDAEYVYDEVRHLIQAADLAAGTLNTTLSDASAHTGCVETFLLTSDARSAVAMANAGFDVMSVATNHIMNCAGDSCGMGYTLAFRDTLDNLRLNNILPVGAGLVHAEAMQPVVVEVDGVRFGFVSLGMVNEAVFGGENRPGIAVLNEDNLREAIAAAQAEADVVIAMPHWGPEDDTIPDDHQMHLARLAVEAGADLVVGNHTHVIQAVEQIDGVQVFYGLGNFIFDQTWDRAHQQGVILLVHFEGTKYLGYELIPTLVDGDGTVHIAGAAEAGEILDRMREASLLIRR